MSSSNILRLSLRNNLGTKTSGFGAFVISKSIQLHFAAKWDFASGLMEKQKRETYERSSQRTTYDRIAQQLVVLAIVLGHLQQYILQEDLILTTRDLEDSALALQKTLASNESIITDVTNMMQFAKSKGVSFASLFTGTDPMVVRMFSKGYIGFETCIAMDSIANFITPYVSSDLLLEANAAHLKNVKKLFSINTLALKSVLTECKNNV